MAARIFTVPQEEPVSTEAALEHLRLQGEEALAEADYVATLVMGARQHLEQMLWRALVRQTWDLLLPCFPAGAIELPKGNLYAVEEGSPVTHVKYVDGSGTLQTLSSSSYVVDTASVPGKVQPAPGQIWPWARHQPDGVQVRFEVGWDVDLVPVPIKQAILMLVSQMYEHRTPVVTGTIVSKVEFAVEALTSAYSLRVP